MESWVCLAARGICCRQQAQSESEGETGTETEGRHGSGAAGATSRQGRNSWLAATGTLRATSTCGYWPAEHVAMAMVAALSFCPLFCLSGLRNVRLFTRWRLGTQLETPSELLLTACGTWSCTEFVAWEATDGAPCCCHRPRLALSYGHGICRCWERPKQPAGGGRGLKRRTHGPGALHLV